MNDKIKAHWDEYKKLYIGLAIGAGVTVAVMKRPQIINLVAPQINPVFNNSNTVVNYGGYCTKIVKHLETGEIFETAKGAAAAAGVDAARMSRHLNGSIPHINGEHFEIIGVGTTG